MTAVGDDRPEPFAVVEAQGQAPLLFSSKPDGDGQGQAPQSLGLGRMFIFGAAVSTAFALIGSMFG